MEYCWLFFLFIKYYNERYWVEKDNAIWGKTTQAKKVWILAQMVSALGLGFSISQIGKCDKCKPGSVFVIENIKDVVNAKKLLRIVLLVNALRIVMHAYQFGNII